MDKINKKFWIELKWLSNYMVSIIMYAIIVILLLVGVILSAYFIDVKKRGNSTLWEPPLYGAYVIVSGSMEPIIKINDAIIIKRVDTSTIKIGDVVTYKSEDPSYYGILITHRVIDIMSDKAGNRSFVTKGDNNSTRDRNSVLSSQIYGKVIMRIPKLGYIQYFLATSYGWIIAVVIPCLGIIVYDIVKLVKNIKSNVDRKKVNYYEK